MNPHANFQNVTSSTLYIRTYFFQVEEKYSVRYQRVLHQQPVICTLEECFELHTKACTLLTFVLHMWLSVNKVN